MATVTGLTKERMLEIEAASVVDGLVNLYGDLILLKRDESQINAGSVIGPQGSQGIQGIPGNQGIQGPQGNQGIQGLPGDSLKVYTGIQDDGTTNVNGWQAVAEFILSSQYADANAIFAVASQDNDFAYQGLIRVNIKQLSVLGGGTTRAQLICTDLRNISPNDFKIEIREASATRTQGFVWMRSTAPFTTPKWVVLYKDPNIVFSDSLAIWNVGGEPAGLTGSVKGIQLSQYAAYAFRSHAAATQTLTSSTWTKMTQSVEVYNIGAAWDNASDTFIAPMAGVYAFAGYVPFALNATGQRYVTFDVNGTRVQGRQNHINLAANIVEIHAYAEVKLAAADVVSLVGYQNSGGNLATSNVAPDVGVSFMGHLIGKA